MKAKKFVEFWVQKGELYFYGPRLKLLIWEATNHMKIARGAGISAMELYIPNTYVDMSRLGTFDFLICRKILRSSKWKIHKRPGTSSNECSN